MEKEKRKTCVMVLLTALATFAIVELVGLVNMRAIYADESWYSNPALNLLHGLGLRNTIIGNGGNANFVFPLFIAGSMKIFGESLFAMRFASVFCGLVSLLVLHLIMNEFECKISSRAIGYGLFVSLSVFNLDFRIARPESAAIMFCLVGIWCFVRYYRLRLWRQMLWLSVTMMVSFFCHPFTMLMYASMGLVLLVEAVRGKDKKGLANLAMLLVAAVIAMVLLYWIDNELNRTVNDVLGQGWEARLFVGGGVWEAFLIYVRQVFVSKNALFTVPFAALVGFMSFRAADARVRGLARVGLLFVVAIPFVFPFSAMLVYGCVYLAVIGVCVSIGAIKQYVEQSTDRRKNKFVMAFCAAYCLFNFALINGYNYTKYDSCNTDLPHELAKLVPDGSVVYGSLDLWPFLMNTKFYSTHYRLDLPSYDDYDFILTGEKQERQCQRLHPAFRNPLHE